MRRSGREIDQEFISHGFVSVKAEVAFIQRVFGEPSYDALVDAHSGPEAFERFRTHEETVRSRLDAMRNAGTKGMDEAWELVISDQKLPGFSKAILLEGLMPSRYEELVRPHVSFLLEAQKEEQEQVCKRYMNPPLPLSDKNTASLRKEACNSVMADAYEALGFEVSSRKRGVDSFVKRLTPDFSVYVEPDIVLLERDNAWPRLAPSVYWPLVSYDRFCYLGSGDRKNRERYITFTPIVNCIAATHLSRYDDTRSFEAMIRADALWYEFSIAPFEDAIIETSRAG